MDPQVPNTITPQTPQIPKIEKDSHWISILAMAIFVIFSLGVVAFLYYQNQQLKNMLVSYQPTPIASPTPIAIPDATINWKSKVSNSISFKYPTNLTLEERQKNYFVLLSNANNPSSVFVSVDARLTGTYADYDKAVVSIKSGLISIQTQEINNGVKISGKIGPGYGQGQQVTTAVFKYLNGAIGAETTATDSSQLKTFDQILSTFKFTTMTPYSSPSATVRP
jgi:hypothetical protein